MPLPRRREKPFFPDILLLGGQNTNYDVKALICAVRLAAGRVFLYALFTGYAFESVKRRYFP